MLSQLYCGRNTDLGKFIDPYGLDNAKCLGQDRPDCGDGSRESRGLPKSRFSRSAGGRGASIHIFSSKSRTHEIEMCRTNAVSPDNKKGVLCSKI